jgi:hypothetical protein
MQLDSMALVSDSAPEAISSSSGDSVLNEILWNFSHYKDAERLSLAQNPRFYVGLPTSPDGYHATFNWKPTERYEGTIYVLTNNSHHVFFEFGGSLRAFDNVWNTNDVLIFRGERLVWSHFSRPN